MVFAFTDELFCFVLCSVVVCKDCLISGTSDSSASLCLPRPLGIWLYSESVPCAWSAGHCRQVWSLHRDQHWVPLHKPCKDAMDGQEYSTFFFLFSNFANYLVCRLCVCGSVYTMVRVSSLLHHVGPKDGTKAVGLSSKYLTCSATLHPIAHLYDFMRE